MNKGQELSIVDTSYNCENYIIDGVNSFLFQRFIFFDYMKNKLENTDYFSLMAEAVISKCNLLI